LSDNNPLCGLGVFIKFEEAQKDQHFSYLGGATEIIFSMLIFKQSKDLVLKPM
jgi:hypothetical protein